MSNLELWHRVSKTDPAAVKQITGKQYSGNSPKPYYIVQRLTEEFGPCGIGWGFTILSERMERLSPTDMLHIAHVRLWYILGGIRGELDQMGQTKATYLSVKDGKERLIVDEDAPKKSATDALVKCASYLGFAGDIFSGRWDDSKYVTALRQEFAEERTKAAGEPTHPAQDMSPQARAKRISLGVIDGDAAGAAKAMAGWDQPLLDSVWALLSTQSKDQLTAAWPATEAS